MTMKKSLVAIFAVSSMFFVNETAASAGTIDSGKGWSITWTSLGNPLAARQIAVCPHFGWMYALNQDGSLWFSSNNGADGSWGEVEVSGWHLPSDSSIACVIGDGQTSGGYLVFLVKSQNQIWSMPVNGGATDYGWTFRDNSPSLVSIGGDYPLWGVKTDNSIWSSTTWGIAMTGHGSLSGVSRIAGWAGTKNFVLDGGSVLFADNASNLSTANLQSIPMGGAGNPVAGSGFDMSVGWGSPDVPNRFNVYVLDGNFELWSGVIRETSCSDGVDNDNNGYFDYGSWDPDPACTGP